MLEIEAFTQPTITGIRNPTTLYCAQSIADLKASRNQPLREAQQNYQNYLEGLDPVPRKVLQLQDIIAQLPRWVGNAFPTQVTALIFLPNVNHTAETYPSPDNQTEIYDRDLLEVGYPSLTEAYLHMLRHKKGDSMGSIQIGDLNLVDQVSYIDLLHQPQAQGILRASTWPHGTGVLLKSRYSIDAPEGKHMLYRVYCKSMKGTVNAILRQRQPQLFPRPATSAA